MTKLFIITGASGTGKSTLVPMLQDKLSNEFKVYDFDQILRPYDLTDSWPWEVTEKMLKLAEENSKQDINTICCGLIRPFQVEEVAKNYSVKNIQLCLLDITQQERENRLLKRGNSEHLLEDLDELVGFRSWIKESQYPSITFECSDLTPEQLLEKVLVWITESSS